MNLCLELKALLICCVIVDILFPELQVCQG